MNSEQEQKRCLYKNDFQSHYLNSRILETTEMSKNSGNILAGDSTATARSITQQLKWQSQRKHTTVACFKITLSRSQAWWLSPEIPATLETMAQVQDPWQSKLKETQSQNSKSKKTTSPVGECLSVLHEGGPRFNPHTCKRSINAKQENE